MVDISLIAWWLIAGWCGTRWPGHEIPRPPVSKVLLVIAVSLVGAVIGGWVFVSIWPPTEATVDGVYAAVSGLPAFAGAKILSNMLQVLALGPQPIPPGKPQP